MNKPLLTMSSALIATLLCPDANAAVLNEKRTEVFRFENGLTLLVREDDSSPVVSVQAWVATGSIHEGRWLGSGISHFVEHMLFKGTERRGVGQIAREAHELGGRMNAYTSLDRTVYYIDLPSRGWASALDLLVDAVFHSNFPADEFTKEQEVIRREFAMGKDDPSRIATLELLATSFAVHPYRYPTIGYLDLFNTLSREDLVAYHAARYVPENVTFIVVGDVKSEAVRREFSRLTETLPRRFLHEVIVPQEPRQLAPRRESRAFPTELLHLRMGWHVPGITHPDVPALDVLAVILGQGLSSRLHQSLVERKGLAHSISAFSFTPRDIGLFAVAAVAEPDKEKNLTEAILEQLHQLTQQGVSEEELNKAQRQVLTSFLSGLETMEGQAADIGQSWFLARNPDYSASYLGKIRSVTRDDVRRVAEKYLTTTALTTVSLRPELSPDKIDQDADHDTGSTSDSSHHPPLVEHQLSNGVRLILQRQPRLPLATLQIVWLGGLLAEDAETNGLARLSGNLLLKGTRKRTAEQIATAIENLGGSISVETGHNTSILSLNFLAEDLETASALAAEVLLEPTFPEEELERERSLQIAAIRRERDQPMAICGELLRQELYGSAHPYSRNPLGTEAILPTFVVDDVQDFHTRTLRGATTVIALFGDIDPVQAAALLEKHFSKIPPGSFTVPTAEIPMHDERRDVRLSIPKQQAVIQIGFPGIAINDPLRPAFEVLIQALSDMSSRLFTRIREEQGLAYFVGAAQRMGPLPGHAVLYAGAAPEKAQHVISELLDEAAQVAKNGLNEEEVSRAKTKLISELVMQRQSIAALARTAALNELYGLGAASAYLFEEKIEAVSVEDVRLAASKLFSAPPVVALVTPAKSPSE